MFRPPICLAAIALLAACEESGGQVSAADANQRADAHFVDVLPQVKLDALTKKTEDLGLRWRVTYYPPNGSTGPNSLSVEIDKRTGELVKGLKGPNYVED